MFDNRKKNHVCFVRGPIICAEGSINNEATPCIAFAYLAGTLRKHEYDVTIVDAIAEGLNNIWPLPQRQGFVAHGLALDEVVSRIPTNSDVIAFSVMFSGEWPVLRNLIMRVRERFPDVLLIAGGEHATALPEYNLRDCPALDVIVRGEGEYTLLEILEAYNKGDDIRKIEGISLLNDDSSYYENGGVRRIRDITKIPWPYWPEGYMEKFWAAGKSYGPSTERDMPFMSSRGCPFRCTFCSNPQMWGFRYEIRDPDDCIAEIKSYIDRYKITSLQFYDLTAITRKNWVVSFCQKLLDNGIRLNYSLPSGTRSEALDAETLDLLKRTGCHYLVYAPESGSRKTLQLVKKQINLDNITASIYEALRQGIVVRTNLIIGIPGETRFDILKTLLFGMKMAFQGVDEAPIYLYSPYPGSENFQNLQAQGKIKINDDYFFALTSLNGKYLSFRSMSFNSSVGPLELVIYRLAFMLINYAIAYLFYPKRILRTLRNLFTNQSSTVLEHRIKDALKRSMKPKTNDALPTDNGIKAESRRTVNSI